MGPSAPPLVEECGVCLDAVVEVEIDNCHHKLCSECAKAICCLEVSRLCSLPCTGSCDQNLFWPNGLKFQYTDSPNVSWPFQNIDKL